jgi:hypothetical protein
MMALYRADPKDIPKIVETVFGSHTFSAIGWSIAALSIIGSIIMIRFLNSQSNKEIQRLVDERNDLQTKLLGKGGNEH